jgi:HrpA-like RNA helicase
MFERLYVALSQLPVADIADDVSKSVTEGFVVVVSSATGSGKTLYTTCKLADEAGEQVVVCVPRRYLAENAAEIICELSGLTLGEEVGYAVGKQSGEQSRMSARTRLLFVTYGYAISSGLVNRAKYIINDEVHEASMDMSIVRALLHRRLKNCEDVKLMEMSATIDPIKQAGYYNDQVPTKIYQIDGRTFPCEYLEVPVGGGIILQDEGEEPDPEEAIHDFAEMKALESATEAVVAQQVVNLIADRGRKGVLVFRPGVGEVEATAEAIKQLAKRALRKQMKALRLKIKKENNEILQEELDALLDKARTESPLSSVEIATIYGEMDYATRKAAVAPPQDGHVKVLVGTNVVESGVNISWLDGGVTCGTGKQMVVRESGALSLELVALSKWRVQQQEGRVKRFCPGIFVLCSDVPFDSRMEQTSPEIDRLPLTELVMHCASFGIRADELTFDYSPDGEKIKEAEKKLQALGLIDQAYCLTASGKWVTKLPVSSETGAMLWHAKRIGVLGAAVVLACVMEVGGVRKDYRFEHNYSHTGDWFDEMIAFDNAMEAKGGAERNALMEERNISYKRFIAAKEFESDLVDRLEGEDFSASWDDEGMESHLRQCLIAGYVNQLFSFRTEMAYTVNNAGYRIGNSSVVKFVETPFLLGSLRKITPRNGNSPFTILEKVTMISLDDVMAFAQFRPELLSTYDDPRPEYDPRRGCRVMYRVTTFNGVVIKRCGKKFGKSYSILKIFMKARSKTVSTICLGRK